MLQHDTEIIDYVWMQFDCIQDLLNSEDDVELWREALGQIIADAQFLASNICDKKTAVFAHVGRCSHWLRPHQSRWTLDADGGFAAPIGYGGSGNSLWGLPEFDCSFKWQWEQNSGEWLPTLKPEGKRLLEFRVAIPSRTLRHQQAAVHTVWRPGTPAAPNKESVQFYGFRNQDTKWKITAHWCQIDTTYDEQTNTS